MKTFTQSQLQLQAIADAERSIPRVRDGDEIMHIKSGPQLGCGPIFGQVLRARERCARSIAMRAGQALVQIVGHAPTIKRSDLPGLGLPDPGRWPPRC
ncbi:hypothetical protein ASD02_28440 [Ensifer sp. Root1252]|nr:hypothetical protein ASD02_28440 [Ensifer sp. Root1252]KQW79516.1 hypothetical protein ASD03_25485 [Ensifer sp. Root127]KRC74165.1 hypothetical protein ASE32_32195 [Ensifer sp. Root231]KRC97180.1 hypothetical protein ASE47_30175 [Ensifer sp. Root258]MDP9634838.1 hypothetical protein [Ensifer adhaerens]